jgi:membrane associated rhomboid family serine protease
MNPFYQIMAPKRKKRFFLDWSLTWQLIFINVVLFVVFVVLDYVNVLSLEFIALNPSFVLEQGTYWTFLTSMFMHGGIFHLFVNMLSLFFVGGLLEKILGKRRYFWSYLISGLFAGVLFVLLSFIFPADYSSFAVGASGAIFGLVGVLLFLTPNLRVYMMFVPIPIKLKYAAPGLLVLLWLISIAGNIPIGNTAHLGGLLAGLGYGLFLRLKFPKKVKMIDRKFS